METLDARGLSCPEPVIMMKGALDKGPKSCRMLVDAVAARENVSRYARSQGYAVVVSEDGADWVLDVTKG